MITKQQILNAPNGISAYYIRIDNEWGIKLFKNGKGERDSSRFNQEIAYQAGLAPKVGKNVYLHGYFGYYTQHVDMLCNKYNSHKDIPQKVMRKLDRLIDDLYNSCDFEMDTNWENIGVLSDGRLVCVDFGYCDNSYYRYCAR